MDKYDVVIVPKTFSKREERSDVISLSRQKKVHLNNGRKKQGTSRHTADLV